MKINILHDWIYNFSEPEYILKQFNEMYPEAFIHTLHYNKDIVNDYFNLELFSKSKLKYEKSGIWKHIQKFPVELNKIKKNKDLLETDLIITNSKGPMRWIKTSKKKENQTFPFQLAFLYEPYPFIYLDYEQLKDSKSLGTFWDKFSAEDQEKYIREDMAYAKGIDLAITHSASMKQKLDTLYGLNCEIVAPPVDEEIFHPIEKESKDYYLTFVDIERNRSIETIINSFNFIKDKLIIVGDGTYFDELNESLIRDNIKFLYTRDDKSKAKLISQCNAVIVADKNHISMSGFMAMKMGCPVICHNESSIADYIIHQETGVVYTLDNEDGLLPAIYQFEKMTFNKEKSLEIAKQFSNKNFRNTIKQLLDKV